MLATLRKPIKTQDSLHLACLLERNIINAFVISVIQTTTFSSLIFIFHIRPSGTKPKTYLSLVDPNRIRVCVAIKSAVE